MDLIFRKDQSEDPQGSILGPVFFMISNNDLIIVLENVSSELYADDTTLYKSSPLAKELNAFMNVNFCIVLN